MNSRLAAVSPDRDFSVMLINLALVLYPATVLLVPKMNGLIFGLFVLVSIVFVIRRREVAFKASRDEKLFYLSIIAFFFIALLITLNAGFVYKQIGKYLHLLLAIPLYTYLRHIGVKLAYLWYGLVAGSLLTAGIAIYDVIIKEAPRAHGLTHPIVFGDLALVMGCMSLASLGWFKQKSGWQFTLPVVALLSGILASVLSQTRGGWLAVPFIVIVFFWYIKSIFSFRLKVGLAVFVVAVFAVLYAVPQSGISHQVDRTVKSLQDYSGSEITSAKRATSVGTRLEMWQASWEMFLGNPILGVGWGHYLDEAKLQVEQGVRNKSAASFDHPHSQYFTALASGGVLGFTATLMLFLIPAWLFIKLIKQHDSPEISRLALAGLLLIVSYMAFGLSEPLLDRSRSVNFFAFYLVVFFAAIHEQRKQLEEDRSANRE